LSMVGDGENNSRVEKTDIRNLQGSIWFYI
jgi:hypothetical protein